MKRKMHMNWDNVLDFIRFKQDFYLWQLNSYNYELRDMPEGSLNYKKMGLHYRLFQYIKGNDNCSKQIYLKNENHELKEELCRKRFIKDSIIKVGKNLKSIECFLKTFEPHESTAIISTYPKVIVDLINYPEGPNDSEDSWQNEKYEKNESYPENLVHWTASGLKVRSKSESIIASLLEKNNVMYRYEAALKIDDFVIYPDFTLRRKFDGKIFYWEHFGMMDDAEYIQSVNKKLCYFIENNILPWDRLIITFETKDVPLDARNVQSIISGFSLG